MARVVSERLRVEIRRLPAKVRCPFHADGDERTPSMQVYDTHAHCFGCGWHGDAIDFVKEFDHVTFRKAIQILDLPAGEKASTPSREEIEDGRRAFQALADRLYALWLAERMIQPVGWRALHLRSLIATETCLVKNRMEEFFCRPGFVDRWKFYVAWTDGELPDMTIQEVMGHLCRPWRPKGRRRVRPFGDREWMDALRAPEGERGLRRRRLIRLLRKHAEGDVDAGAFLRILVSGSVQKGG